MHGYPTTGFYTHRADLSGWAISIMLYPYASKPREPITLYPKLSQSLNNGLFKIPHVYMDIGEEVFKVNYRVHH
jgi:hypothetical protein